MRNFIYAISSFFRVIWTHRYEIIPIIVILLLVALSIRYIKWLSMHSFFCVRLRRFCKKNHMKYKSEFFRNIFSRKSFLGYTIFLSKENTNIVIQFFPYYCHKRCVWFLEKLQNVLIYKETVQIKTELGKGESNAFYEMNKVTHGKRKKALQLSTNQECVFLVFTSAPSQIFLTNNGIKTIVDSGYKSQNVTIYKADDFINYLDRVI